MTTWSAEQKQEVFARWDKGEGAVAIAKTFGVSRNAIIGLVHRHHSGGRRRAFIVPRAARPKHIQVDANRIAKVRDKAIATKPLRVRPPDPTEPVPLNLPLVELTGRTCKFPIGEETGRYQLFCGAAKPADGAPYCGWHYKLARSVGTYSERVAVLRELT